MGDADLRCRCYGIDKRTRCERDATQEDGLCDVCRCPHGCCSDHWLEEDEWTPTLFFDDPTAWMEGFAAAHARSTVCLIEKKVGIDE